jgi:mRNA interferase MazF
LAKDSVANLTALVTLGKSDLDPPVGRLPEYLMDEVNAGLKLILDL